MKTKAGLLFSVSTLIFTLAGAIILYLGIVKFEAPLTNALPLSQSFLEGAQHPLSLLLLQIVVIIVVTRLISVLLSRIGQPSVVAEILGGIVLGPSILGYFVPDLFMFLFPVSSYAALKFISEIGLLFFMFIIGMDLDVKVFKTQARAALTISHVGLMAPIILGMAAAYFLYPLYGKSSFPVFALFMGIASSITAFPVLARIVQERGLGKTPVGSMAIACAAAADFTAWCFLAIVIAVAKAGDWIEVVISISLAVGYVAAMLYGVRPVLHKIGSVYASKETFNRKFVAVIFLVLVGSAYLAEVIGVHALFGAFIAGVVMPHNISFKKIITEKIEDVSVVLFLPLFFVFAGLKTDLNVLSSVQSWLVFGLVLIVSVVGKLGGTVMAARWHMHSWKDAWSLGALMNTRGLMEIVILGIGLELGIISSSIFTIMVLMALVTTMLTAPLLNFIERKFSEPLSTQETNFTKKAFTILVSFGPPKMGSTLLRLADQLTLKMNAHVQVKALHITPSKEVKPYEALLYEREGFQPIRAMAHLLGVHLETLYRNTEKVDREIFQTVENGNFDLVLVGAARPMFNDKATGGILKQLLTESEANVGVLIDRGFVLAEGILLLFGSEDDRELLQYAHRFMVSNKARITVLKMGEGQAVDLHDPAAPYAEFATKFNEVIEQRIPDVQLLSHYNLILVSLDQWNQLNAMNVLWIKECPSVLVIKHVKDLEGEEIKSKKSDEE